VNTFLPSYVSGVDFGGNSVKDFVIDNSANVAIQAVQSTKHIEIEKWFPKRDCGWKHRGANGCVG
jgi:hypothetical protein